MENDVVSPSQGQESEPKNRPETTKSRGLLCMQCEPIIRVNSAGLEAENRSRQRNGGKPSGRWRPLELVKLESSTVVEVQG